MLEIARKYGVPNKLVNAIGLLYQNTSASVLSPDGETEQFEIKAGVLQGDTLAPFLFALVVDYAMRQAIDGREAELGFEITPRKSRRVPAIIVTDLLFADDIALISEEIEQAQELLNRVETEAAKVGLHMNTKKTEVMAYNHGDVNIQPINGTTLKKVENFKYLGAWMSSSEKDFEIRKAIAWSACHKLKTIWSSQLSRNLKVRLFRATVESVLTYNAETWTVNKSLEKRINGCYTRMLRMVNNVTWKQKLTNHVLYQGLPQLSQTIAEKRMRLAGHCIRHDDEIAHHLALWEPTRGTRCRGRQAVTYVDVLRRDTNLESAQEIRTVMLNRVGWKSHIKSSRVGARPR